MTPTKDDILAKFLDGLQREIHEMEAEYGMQAGKGDLRTPIDAHHDAVRVWMAEEGSHQSGDRLSVEWLAHDVTALRQRVHWLRSGAHVFWEGRDPYYKTTLENARQCKRDIILAGGGAVDVPSDVLKADLLHFGRRIKREMEQGGNPLKHTLTERDAEKFVLGRSGKGGNWRRIKGDEFWSAFEYTAGFFSELARELPNVDEKLMLGHDGKTQKVSKTAMIKQGEEALKNLWVQIKHPLILKDSMQRKKSLISQGTRYVFDSRQFISEKSWQEMEVMATRLSDAYERYTVMFAAAMAATVDVHYKDLLGDLDQIVSDAADIMLLIDEMLAGNGQIELHTLERMIHEIEDEELKRTLLAILDSMKANMSDYNGSGMKDTLQNAMDTAEAKIETLEQAHFNFLMAQFSVYEQSTDLIKKLGQQGINVAGKFVDAANAVSAARGKGGGGGQGR